MCGSWNRLAVAQSCYTVIYKLIVQRIVRVLQDDIPNVLWWKRSFKSIIFVIYYQNLHFRNKPFHHLFSQGIWNFICNTFIWRKKLMNLLHSLCLHALEPGKYSKWIFDSHTSEYLSGFLFTGTQHSLMTSIRQNCIHFDTREIYR